MFLGSDGVCQMPVLVTGNATDGVLVCRCGTAQAAVVPGGVRADAFGGKPFVLGKCRACPACESNRVQIEGAGL